MLLVLAASADAPNLAGLRVSPAEDLAIGAEREGVLLTGGDLFHLRFSPFGAKYFLGNTSRLIVHDGSLAAHYRLVATPEVDFILLRVVCDGVAVTARDPIDWNVESAVHSQRRVFLTAPTQCTVIIAAPRQDDSVTGKSDCVHTAARDLNNRLQQRHARRELELDLPGLLDLEGVDISEAELVALAAAVYINLCRCHFYN